jgi:ligand-binding sensor domain-containing protein
VAGEWRSWTAGNQVRAVLQAGDQALTAGPGGLTFWQADGEVEWRLTPVEGLPGSDATALLLDFEGGSLFVGTNSGLLEAGTDSLTIHDTWNGLDSGSVTALVLARQGVLAGTQGSARAGGGLNVLGRGLWRPLPGFPSTARLQGGALSSDVTVLLEDSSGVLWVGTTGGLGRRAGEAWTRFGTENGLPADEVLALAEALDTVWAGTPEGLARFDSEADAWEVEGELPPEPVTALLATTAGELWAGGPAGLWRLGDDGWQGVDVGELAGQAFYGGAETADGEVLFGTDAGLARFGEDGERTVWAVPDTPAHNAFRRILLGPEAGSLVFVAERGFGADPLDLDSETWLPGVALPCAGCVPLGWDRDGIGYFGGAEGLWLVDGGEVTRVTTADGLPSDLVNDVAFGPGGGYWIATPAGIAVFDGQRVTEVLNAANTGLATDEVRWVLPASGGALWVLTGHSASLYAGGEWTHFGQGDPFRGEVTVTDMAEDANGGVWLSTLGEGVYLYEDGNWSRFESLGRGVELPSDDVRCVEPDAGGALWFCTGLGASRLADGEWALYDQPDALVDLAVNDIYVDAAGAVWFATSGGVTAYSPEE